MPVTGYKRFTTLADEDGWDFGNPSNFLAGGDSGVISSESPSLTDPPYAILKDPNSFGVPANATITGVEVNITIGATDPSVGSLTSNQVWNGELALTDLEEGDLTSTFITISPGAASEAATNYLVGGDGNLLGLSLTPSNLSDLQLGFKLAAVGRTTATLIGVFGEIGNGSGALAIPSPAVRIYYTVPPGEGFLIRSGQLSINSGQLYIRE